MNESGILSTKRSRECFHGLRLRHTEEGCLGAIESNDVPEDGCGEGVVGIDDVRSCIEHSPQRVTHLLLRGVGRTIDLRHERRLYRGTGRHFDDLHGGGAESLSLGRECGANRASYIVALTAAIVLIDEVDL